MNYLIETYTLNNGVKIPKIAYGTWQIPNEEAYQTTLDAIRVGYRHIDTAKSYHNEEAVGRAFRDSGVSRDELFVVSKLRAPALGYDQTIQAFNLQLQELGLDYMDGYLMHAPWPWDKRGESCDVENVQAYKAMEDLYKQGKIRAIGVSNFSVHDLQNILDNCEIVPMINQIRFSVGYTQDEIVDFCSKHNILVEAYSPLGTGSVFQDETLIDIASKYHVSVAQLCLRYCLDKGTLPLPKSKNRERMIENAKLDFLISDEDQKILDEMDEIKRML